MAVDIGRIAKKDLAETDFFYGEISDQLMAFPMEI